MSGINRQAFKYSTFPPILIFWLKNPGHLKVHKNENFFGSYFEFCTISLLVMFNY